MNVPVALVGEGADEVFLGYPTYFKHDRLAAFWRLRDYVPQRLRAALYMSLAPLLGALGLEAHHDLVRRAAAGETMFLGSDLSFPDVDKLRLGGAAIQAEVERRSASFQIEKARAELGTRSADDPIALMGFGEIRMRMAEQLLMRVDKLSMAHSVEVRAPFLNRKLVEYALALPSGIRAAGGRPKALLRRAVSDLLPAVTIARPKMGFGTPAQRWFCGSFSRRLEDLLADSELVRAGILSGGEIRRLMANHRRGPMRHHQKLWNLLCLLEWSRQIGISDVAVPEASDLRAS
jgi:asparagine synthase (glutamine-hydrolysing)